jgi:zinc protease
MRRFLWILFIALIPGLSDAADAPVHEYRLDNGLRLIVKEDHRSPVVFSSIWYKVGGSYEPRGITGISHALEHLMFRGTAKYGPGKLSEIVNANGGDQNAMTAEDFTVYFQSLPADKLAVSFELESDRMSHLTLDDSAFTKEIQVVMEERRMRTEDDPQALTTERLNAIAFINNPYNQPVVGWMSDLQQMTASDLRQWYQQWYVPNNAIIIVIGDVKPEQVLELAKQYFSQSTAKSLSPIKPTQEISDVGSRYLKVRVPAQLPWVILGYNTPSLTTAAQSSDPYALTVLAYLLGGGDSSRLNHDLVRGQQIAASASANYDLYHLHSGLLTISATPTKNISSPDLQLALEKEVAQLQKDLVSPQELARAKALLVAEHVFEQDSLMAQAFNLGLPEMTGLSWRVESEFIPHIEKVTAQQVREAAQRYLTPTQLTVGVLEPVSQPSTPASAPSGEPHEQSTIH